MAVDNFDYIVYSIKENNLIMKSSKRPNVQVGFLRVQMPTAISELYEMTAVCHMTVKNSISYKLIRKLKFKHQISL